MTTTTTPAPAAVPSALSRLYLARSGFALVWAVLLFVVGSSVGPATVALLVLYPIVDVAAAVIDARASHASEARAGDARVLAVNVAVSTLAALALVVALAAPGATVPAVLLVWGAWAVVAGLVQLAVALRRRSLGGQGAMIASGSISVLAGVSFVVMSTSPGATPAAVAGYALLGGVFFLVSALRLRRFAGR
jgi:uncharacterized membrane protein HdeD (DUF308 family)